MFLYVMLGLPAMVLMYGMFGTEFQQRWYMLLMQTHIEELVKVFPYFSVSYVHFTLHLPRVYFICNHCTHSLF